MGKSMPEPVVETVDFLGSKLKFELNHYAYKADAALTLQKGETTVLVTVTVGDSPIDANFTPLSVEYIEKYYAGGIISSSRFIKRETRPSDDAVLKARQVDHAIRSLFPKYWRTPVSVVITVLSYDHENDPEQLAVIAASSALMLSSVPFAGPSASVKVGLSETGSFIWAPTESEEEKTEMDMIVSVVGERVLNVEGWANEVSEDVMKKMLEESVAQLQPILKFQEDLAQKHGREKQAYEDKPAPTELIDRVANEYGDRIKQALLDKDTRRAEMAQIQADFAAALKEEAGEDEEAIANLPGAATIEEAVEYVARKEVRKMVLQDKQRTSGRELTEIRPLKIETEVLPRVHGSAVFTRGITQSLSVLTLGALNLAQTIASFEGEETRRFMHHYSSPNYSFGDAGRFSYYPGRREIGHGNIGENAIRPLLPAESEFPYTIRVNSEIMSSNGSTSMAATCAASLALFDSGVPIRAMAAGVALGLVTDDEDLSKYEILTDMEDVEDFYGDMDFKVTGTKNGITAIQLDNKLRGVPVEILQAAFDRSKDARLEILDAMYAVISEPSKEMKQYAPKVDMVKINPEKIGELIGPGGKVIRGMLEELGSLVQIDIQDDGTVVVMAPNKELRDKALEMIDNVVGEVEIGQTYDAVVGKLTDYGAFVDFEKGSEGGLVHISEVKDGFVKNVEEVLKVGQKVRVKVVARDDQGRLKLSIKQAEEIHSES
ncbi:MAG: polyribonucleotide nucleotidyltransferase [Candidatus Dojkabacteria bacterium]